jgi:glycosyltransferase involved in cell wall biosynthesis
MTADPIGGVWRHALTLCGALAAQDVEVHLATLGAPLTPGQRSEAVSLANLELHESRYRLEWMEHPWMDLEAAGEWLLALQDRHRCSVIHLNHLVHGELPWGAPVLTVGHSCVLSWWNAVRREPAPPEWLPYKRRVMRSLKAASCVVAPTRALLVELERHYGPLRRGEVIPNGARLPDPGEEIPPQKEPFVLCAGRLWDEGKNVQALADVAPLIDWPVYVAGAQAGPDGSAASLAALRLLGRLERGPLARWYARAAIYALPARYEPFGLTVLEAALRGCALVLGDIESLREVWDDAALYVPPDDRDALRAVLGSLIAGPKLRTAWAQKAGARAREYSHERMAGVYFTLYRQLEGQYAAPATAITAEVSG